MNKYLSGSKYNIPMVSTEVPSGSLQSVAYTLKRMSPTDDTNTYTVTGNFLAVDNATGEIMLPSTGVGIRSAWRLSYTLTNTTSVAYPYTADFLIEAEDVLVKGVNSYQSYFEVMLTAEEIPGLDAFKAATKEDQIAALVSAYDTLNTMTYADRSGDHYNVGSYDAVALDALEPGFLRALRIAQVIEANEMLDPNSIHYKRLDGLMSETIGESSMMFRPGNINNTAITRRSMMFLRNYVVIRARIYRA